MLENTYRDSRNEESTRVEWMMSKLLRARVCIYEKITLTSFPAASQAWITAEPASI